jgi:hypothetical protein
VADILLLFIDGRRKIQSVTKARISVPFVRERFRHGLWRGRTLLAAFRYDHMFIQALTVELTQQFGSVPWALPHPAGVIDAGERAIADGLIEVACALPDEVVLTFNREQPTAPHGFDAVIFTSPKIAASFLIAVLKGKHNQVALEAALEHPAGSHYARVVAGQQAAGSPGAMPVKDAALVQRASALLTKRALALFPHDLSRRRLRVAWLEHRVPSVPTANSSVSLAPSPVATARPPPSAAPMSVLPDPPAVLSPQARTLIGAAKNGTPFCEECARRAAELADV